MHNILQQVGISPFIYRNNCLQKLNDPCLTLHVKPWASYFFFQLIVWCIHCFRCFFSISSRCVKIKYLTFPFRQILCLVFDVTDFVGRIGLSSFAVRIRLRSISTELLWCFSLLWPLILKQIKKYKYSWKWLDDVNARCYVASQSIAA